MTSAKRNYGVIKREALDMIYALHKFMHYLLGNKVIFHVDHQEVLYSVKKFNLHVVDHQALLYLIKKSNLHVVWLGGCYHFRSFIL